MTAGQHHLKVLAYDMGTPSLTGTLYIDVTVEDANDNAPKFDKELYATVLLETAPRGTTVITVAATDADSGANGRMSYRFTARTQAAYGHQFSVDATTGDVLLLTNARRLERAEYVLGVVAEDGGEQRDSRPTSPQSSGVLRGHRTLGHGAPDSRLWSGSRVCLDHETAARHHFRVLTYDVGSPSFNRGGGGGRRGAAGGHGRQCLGRRGRRKRTPTGDRRRRGGRQDVERRRRQRRGTDRTSRLQHDRRHAVGHRPRPRRQRPGHVSSDVTGAGSRD